MGNTAAMRLIVTLVLALVAIPVSAVGIPASAVGTPAQSARPTAPPPRPRIVWDPIPFGAKRKAEMVAYVRRHYGSFMRPPGG